MRQFVKKYRFTHAVSLCCILSIVASPSFAQNIPGSADPARIIPFKQETIPEKLPSKPVIPQGPPDIDVPDASKQVRFELKHITLEGITAFSESEFADTYRPYLNQEVTLDKIWMIAGQITERYQNKGYFLSRAYVPAQEIEEGIVTIKMVEGTIAEVQLDDASVANDSLVQKLIERLKAKRPISAYDLESFMLQMNALAGKEFRAIVEPTKKTAEGRVKVSLIAKEKKAQASFSFDNSGSRFLGPYQTTVTYKDSFLPLQQTTLSAFVTTQTDELKYGAFQHSVPFYPDWSLLLSGGYVVAEPGASIRRFDVTSHSTDLGIGISWQPIRLRQENLIASLELSGKNTNVDTSNTPLTRDRVRAARAKLSYEVADDWNGYNYLTLRVNQGLEALGASKAGDRNLSHAEAEPNFTTAQVSYTRQQAITSDFMVISQLSGQLASGPLFSSEEFGYGGQSFGRAYDPSEIVGDHGMAASLELRYLGVDPWHDISFIPYSFYDIGEVWNEDAGGIDASGASAGVGIRLNHKSGFTNSFGLAWPLTRGISHPIYGDSDNPRILLQLSYGF